MKGSISLWFVLFGLNVYSQTNTYIEISPILSMEQVEEAPVWQGCESFLIKQDIIDCFLEKIQNHVKENLVYPKMALYQGIAGRVWVSFLVGSDGSLIDVVLARGIGGGCDEEAVRIMKLLPNFLPAKTKDEAVSCGFNFAVVFELPEDYWKNRKKKYSKKALGLE